MLIKILDDILLLSEEHILLTLKLNILHVEVESYIHIFNKLNPLIVGIIISCFFTFLCRYYWNEGYTI
jgi:hypothetical protein